MKTPKFLFILFLLLPLCIWAQGIEVSGSVVSADDNIPLAGVTVQVENTNKGVITDFDGNYVMENADENATLIFNFIGFKTQEIQINGRSVIDVVMSIDAASLDEIVVTGLW